MTQPAASGPRPALRVIHPFYGPSAQLLADRDTAVTGLLTMGAYLAFWAAAVAIALRRLDRRFSPPGASAAVRDEAIALARVRYARGEIDAAQLRSMVAVLQQTGCC